MSLNRLPHRLGKTSGFSLLSVRRVEDLFGAASQRHPVLAFRLGPRGRDGPHVVRRVDLGPRGPAHLAGPSRREHEKLERQLDSLGRVGSRHRRPVM